MNAAMNLVAGSELAWQERMAESFVFSPLYCGSKTTGYRPTSIKKEYLDESELELDEASIPKNESDSDEKSLLKNKVVPGYGDGIRLGTAVSVSARRRAPIPATIPHRWSPS